MPKLAIIILSFNTKEITLNCISSIISNPPKKSYEIVVVDNASTDQTVSEIKQRFKTVKILENKENLGFSAGNNKALKSISAEYYLLLNSDTKILPNSLDNLILFADTHTEYGVISCKLLNPNKAFQPNSGELPKPFNTFLWLANLDILFPGWSYQARSDSYYQDGKEVGWVSGSVMLIKDEVIKKVGVLDENIFMYGEDVEYCMRVKQNNFKVGWTNQAEVIHVGGASSEKPQFKQWLGEFQGVLYIYQKYYGQLTAKLMKQLFYFFIILRALIFTIMGKLEIGRTYAKVAINL
ncbi:hypothetical protein A3H85_00850 [Candidatus Daviesbacteria bacterium RIFCSPLOWO2_02_FULL_40_8]|uniref:Glycosyltransferase 2-like domain-containing protein n=1 Tax=Candidatus Daviesbacteria bacterium RIFCSPLOWO2_01_FULL_40_24 TaxID=1797787 RepID=A0A1F5MJ87_9BACT|nr:MAG: hypothetical protein A3C32_04145 [Candidatus Daviesbacteria bacterium RIFCSPHIGHO2_02_FULL_41_14]OGE65418.1 MAG: hypothetical protein A3B49_00840 [Candidatus Daviesbacteria bacterium RIFCSPLOWO2_01_FULL_40_24]OGE66979.1 MAG: hypothetical protein A3H85_00850 [Candidatus Daviesbacteria bacterium RIFCSPLOWO2_02_FULL_40_8]OGH82005.1 MAG: hypothetical protein A3F93_04250 [Candidatus Magasanikbacteria bacterium RIFCSPLOWO2_12_FULL_34_7]